MAQLWLKTDLIKTIKKKVYNKYNITIFLEIIEEYLSNQLFYLIEDEIYFSSGAISFRKEFKFKYQIEEIYLPIFNTFKIEDVTEYRFINQNDIMIKYEDSELYAQNQLKAQGYLEKKKSRQLNPNATAISKKSKEEQKIIREKMKQKEINKVKKKQELFNTAVSNKEKILCFDVEKYESKQKHVLEIGFTTLQDNVFSTTNLIILDNIHLKNGKFVDNNQDFNLFGQDKIVSLSEAKEILKKEMEDSSYIVGQDISNDFKVVPNIYSKEVFDTQYSFIHSELGFTGKSCIGLKKLLDTLEIQHSHLHNASNDSYFTLLVALKISNRI
jgi:hypothetical protein